MNTSDGDNGEEVAVNASEPSFGMVSWLDVLGFRRLLSSNEDKVDVWVDVLRFLRKSHEIQETHQPTKYQILSVGLRPEDYRVTVFADTIVTSVNLSHARLTRVKEWHWISLFLTRTAYLYRKMFEYGLPIRGGISYGKFYHSDIGFAGRPFVAAECLSSRLELSACVISDECMEYLKPAFEPGISNLDSNHLWFKHPCPVKDHPGVKDSFVLNSFSRGTLKATRDANDFQIDLSSADLDQVVQTSFMKHGKQIEDIGVRKKIENTAEMLKVRRRNAMLFS